MKKLSILTLAFVILVPMLLASCNKNDIVGSYEYSKEDAEKFGDKEDDETPDGLETGAGQLNLEKDGSFTLTQSESIEFENVGTNFKVEVEVTGEWEFEGLDKDFKLRCKDFEVKSVKGKLYGEPINSSTRKEIKAQLKDETDIYDINERFKGMKVIEIDDDGFTVKEADNDKIRFNRV